MTDPYPGSFPPPPTVPFPATPSAWGGGSSAPEALLVTMGDIGVSASWVVTPGGSHPLAGTQWMMSNNSQTTESIPAWAIVMAILFFVFCLLGLLFLLVKERRTVGYVQVSVQGPSLYYATQIPVYSMAAVSDVEQRLNYVRSLAAR